MIPGHQPSLTRLRVPDLLVIAGTHGSALPSYLPKLSWRAATLTGLFLFWYVLTDQHYEVVGWLSLREVMRSLGILPHHQPRFNKVVLFEMAGLHSLI